jgi:signal transduction histidine kinase
MLNDHSIAPLSPNTDNNPILGNSSNPFQRWFKQIAIGHKIGMGYALSIGIAVIGTTTGNLFSTHFIEKPALQNQEIAQQKIQILNIFKDSILQARSDIIPYLENPKLLENYSSYLLEDANDVQEVFERLRKITDKELTGKDPEIASLNIFLEKHRKTVKSYKEELELILDELSLNRDSAETTSISLQQQREILLSFISSQSVLNLKELESDLEKILEDARLQDWEANQIRLQAEILQNRAIYASLFLSAAIAVAFGWYTSQAIAQPLKQLTEISQEATQTSNFNLQMPVSSCDEVGKLATSLNHLIRRVNELLEEQKEAQEQLEDRVEQRTAQLQQQAQELEETLQELKQTQLQMIHSEKMSSLGQMVAGVAHEINNPVSFVHGNLVHAQEYTQDLFRLIKLYQQHFPNPPELLQEEIDAIDLDFLLEDLEKVLKSMRVGTERIRDIVISLRNFSRLDESEFKEANLHEGIDNTLMILHNRLKAQSHLSEIKIMKEYGKLPMLECRPGQLNQVFMNILSNAIDALEESNRRNLDVKQPASIAIHTAIKEEWIVIRIADNGPGIPEAIRSKLFDPFFTTKPIGKGTGLGLSISYQIIVDRHNGKLSCYSEPGQGTEFIIEIPVRQAVS